MSTAMTAPILETRELRKAFGGHVVLEDVSLRFQANRLSAIIGPNGAGKTTCFNLLTGFLAPDRGAILFKGGDITALPPDRRARLGICRSFQILNLFNDSTVLENIRVAVPRMRQHGFDLWTPAGAIREAEDKAAAIIRLVGLAGREHVEAKYLSYGQRRLLEIGVTLAGEPDLLLLDEPTNHLDLDSREALEESLEVFPGSIVFVSHDRAFIDRLATRVVDLREGRAALFPGNYSETADARAERRKRPEPAARAEFYEEYRRLSPIGYANSLRALLAMDYITDQLSRLRIPVLLIGGDRDPSLEPMKVMHRKVRGSKLVVLAPSSHFGNRDQPDVWNRTVLEFLARCDRRRAG